MTDKDWIRLLVEDPKHGDVWGLFADWLEDKGDFRSDAVRWAQKEQKFPHDAASCLLGIPKSWDFWTSPERFDTPEVIGYERRRTLLYSIWQCLDGGASDETQEVGFHEYTTCEEALTALFNAYVKCNSLATCRVAK